MCRVHKKITPYKIENYDMGYIPYNNIHLLKNVPGQPAFPRGRAVHGAHPCPVLVGFIDNFNDFALPNSQLDAISISCEVGGCS